jgi:hypothetical protein
MYRGNSSQEKFVIEIFNGKKDGVYVELGAFDSKLGSNTFHLESEYDWNGISFEILEDRKLEFQYHETKPVIFGIKYSYTTFYQLEN